MLRPLAVFANNCFCKKAVFAPSLMFVGILNATLSEEKVSTTRVTQENLELPLSPNSLDSHQTQNNKMKSWTGLSHVVTPLKENLSAG